jgi:hypothetical protein
VVLLSFEEITLIWMKSKITVVSEEPKIPKNFWDILKK